MKIGIISPDSGDACSIYRASGPYKKLPFETTVYDGCRGFFLWDAILNNDVILLQRPFTEQHTKIAQTIKALGKPLIIDWDDDLSCVPDWNPHRASFHGCEHHLHMCATIADHVTVSTPRIADQARKWGAKKITVIKNAIDDSLILPRRERQMFVAWRGSNTHAADIELARPILKKFADKRYIIAFFGERPGWAYEIDHKHFPVMDYCQFMAQLYSLSPSYMVVTLADHPFNYAKSDIAAQECYAVGAKLIHNGLSEFYKLPEWQEPRLLSQENLKRFDIIKSFM
jgi:hypothetical protein